MKTMKAYRKNVLMNDLSEPIQYECKPWWTTTAFESTDGRICVARINAVSLRYRYKGGLESDRYAIGADYMGSPVSYMMDLTEDDLIAIMQSDAFDALPCGYACVCKSRPKSNNPKKHVTSRATMRRRYEWLQSEGYSEGSYHD